MRKFITEFLDLEFKIYPLCSNYDKNVECDAWKDLDIKLKLKVLESIAKSSYKALKTEVFKV